MTVKSLNRSHNWNEYNLNPLTKINWRVSLVPAAAVIQPPIAYIKVVAFKMLVVAFGNEPVGPLQGESLTGLFFFPMTAGALY